MLCTTMKVQSGQGLCSLHIETLNYSIKQQNSISIFLCAVYINECTVWSGSLAFEDRNPELIVTDNKIWPSHYYVSCAIINVQSGLGLLRSM